MANRAYLYTANKKINKLRDVSEFPANIPLQYKILLGVDTKQEKSRIWGNESPMAISGNFKSGLKKFIDFYEYLKTQDKIDKNILDQYIKKTNDFFEKYPDKKLDLFFVELDEIYDLIPELEIDFMNNDVFNSICAISKDIDEILRERPKNVFKENGKYLWLDKVIDEPEILETYWRWINYYSFNESH
jgi:hypothetical protein